MTDMTLIEKLRTGHVRRWHIVAVAREQTIADHMHRVVVITEEILRILGRYSWDDNLTINAMRWAHIHDQHEVKLGDMPTPGKAIVASMLDDGEDVFDDAATVIDYEYQALSDCIANECPLAGLVVKYADTLEAMNYCGIFGMGSHAKEVWQGLQLAAGKAYDDLAEDVGPGRWRDDLLSLIPKLREGYHWS